jgi:cation diffusion facilitator CzcD-associated flavoprotein CzcO
MLHPQFWPEDLDYRGKRVIVIGSGATAVTIVPEMAKQAAHVVMLQRSPTYMVSRPSEDAIASALNRFLPPRLSYRLTRWKNVALQMFFFKLARSRPDKVKQRIITELSKMLPADFDVATHFTPRYNPWDQRLCLVPDADMFEAISAGRASIITGEIDTFTEDGIRLKGGDEIAADMIVAATGLKIQVFSDVAFTIDGARRRMSDEFAYKGMMFSAVPNFSYTFGYTNASWTLKADLTAGYLCRLLRHMDANGHPIAMPRREPDLEEVPFLDFTSGYVQRAKDILPKQASRQPWRVHQNYVKDLTALRWGKLEDGVMEFRDAAPPAECASA